MEENITSFFINGLKIHIESSIKKYENNLNTIFDKEFDNILLSPLFINNINLFRDIISQNDLNFQMFWNHIGSMMKASLQQLIEKFEEEIKKISDEKANEIEIGNKNVLKLQILNKCLYFITNEETCDFDLVNKKDKEIINNLLILYIKKEIENNHDFSLFIKNYIIKMVLLINDNYRKINIGILKFLSFTCYNFESLFMNKEQMNNLKAYIDRVINNPKIEINNYLYGAMNKKNYKKEKLCRSRGVSFDIKETNTNANGIEKNKKIEDFFKVSKKEKIEKINSDENSGGTRETENIQNNTINTNNEREINNGQNKVNRKHIQGKPLHFSSHASNLSLFNLNSGISYNSNSLLLNTSFSFGKNNNINTSKISFDGFDDSFSLTNLFPTPLSELNDKEENKKSVPKLKFPSIIKSVHNKKRKSFERFKNKLFDSQPNIKKYMKIENKKNENEEMKEMTEIRNIINSSFYGNEKNFVKKIKKEINKDEDKGKNQNLQNKTKNGILIFKTPNKIDKENHDENADGFYAQIGINI